MPISPVVRAREAYKEALRAERAADAEAAYEGNHLRRSIAFKRLMQAEADLRAEEAVVRTREEVNAHNAAVVAALRPHKS